MMHVTERLARRDLDKSRQSFESRMPVRLYNRCHTATLRQLVFFLALFLLSVPPATGQERNAECALPAGDEQWMQAALDNWQLAVDDVLRLPPEPLPWIVFFDKVCVWHLAPEEGINTNALPVDTGLTYRNEPVSVRAESHAGEITLPNGERIPVGVVSSTMLYNEDTKPFFVVAMPSIWAEIPGLAEAMDPAGFVLGIIAHELVHTRHLVQIADYIDRDLGSRYDVPENMDDNVVDTRFKSVPGFVQATRAERDLFYRAVASDTASVRADLVREALVLAEDRRKRYFTGDEAVYGELEDIFLSMEGVAVWTHYRLSQLDPDVLLRRSENPERMQEEGLVLFLLLEEMVPDWRTRVFAPHPASPFQMLRMAVGLE